VVVDANITNHVEGHVMVKWEEDELFVDEGFFTLVGSEQFPAYLIAGRQYIPFGNFESHFVTDPTTLVLGETNNGAVVGGYRLGGEMVEVSIGAFNGRIDKAGHHGSFPRRLRFRMVRGLAQVATCSCATSVRPVPGLPRLASPPYISPHHRCGVFILASGD